MNSKLIINILIGFAILGAIVLSYFYLTSERDIDISETSAEPIDIFAVRTGEGENIANLTSGQIITLLNEVRSIRLDTSMFDDPAFRALVDFEIDLTPENVGIENPFILSPE